MPRHRLRWGLVIVSLAGVIAATLVVQRTRASYDRAKDGIPIDFHRASWSGFWTDGWVVYESDLFKPTTSRDPDVLNDPGLSGLRGTHGDVRWVHIPYEYVPSIDPDHAPNPNQPAWKDDLIALAAQNPGVTLSFSDESAWIKVEPDGSEYPLDEDHKMIIFPVYIHCDPANARPAYKCRTRFVWTGTIVPPQGMTELPATLDAFLFWFNETP